MGLDRPGDPVVGHLARLLLLIEALSSHERSVRALSTVARHDFLLRHPVVLHRVLEAQGVAMPASVGVRPSELRAVESRMLRYKFGFWDHRYYALVGRLVAMDLVVLHRVEAPIEISLSRVGEQAAQELQGHRWRLLRGRSALLAEHLHVSGYRLGQQIERALVP